MKYSSHEPDYTEISWWWIVGWSIGAGLICVLATMACAGAIPSASVDAPRPIDCTIEPVPPTPTVLSFRATEEVNSNRVYTTYVQLAELVVWLEKLSTWTGDTNECLRKLTQR